MTGSTAEPGAFRALMGRWPTGVSVVTAHAHGADAGLTVNAFVSISLSPPLVMISLTRDADTTPVVRAAGRFAINLLAHDQRALSERFARTDPSPVKFQGVALHRGDAGVALLDGTLGTIVGRVVDERPVADHVLFFGEVERVDPGRDVAPLLFFRSDYAVAASPTRLELPAPRG